MSFVFPWRWLRWSDGGMNAQSERAPPQIDIVLTWNDLPKGGKRYGVVGSDSRWNGDGGCVYMCRCTRVCVCVCYVSVRECGWVVGYMFMNEPLRAWVACCHVVIVKIVYCVWKGLSWSWKLGFQYDDSGATGLWFPKHLCQLRLPTPEEEQNNNVDKKHFLAFDF